MEEGHQPIETKGGIYGMRGQKVSSKNRSDLGMSIRLQAVCLSLDLSEPGTHLEKEDPENRVCREVSC